MDPTVVSKKLMCYTKDLFFGSGSYECSFTNHHLEMIYHPHLLLLDLHLPHPTCNKVMFMHVIMKSH